MKMFDFMSSVHKSTNRDYLKRVNDPEFPKHIHEDELYYNRKYLNYVSKAFPISDFASPRASVAPTIFAETFPASSAN